MRDSEVNRSLLLLIFIFVLLSHVRVKEIGETVSKGETA